MQIEKSDGSVLERYIDISKWEGEAPKVFIVIDNEFNSLRLRVKQAEAWKGDNRLGKTEKIDDKAANSVLVGVLGIVVDLCEMGNLLYFDPRLQTNNTKNVVEDYLNGYFNIASKLMSAIGKPVSGENLMKEISEQIERMSDLSHARLVAAEREELEKLRK